MDDISNRTLALMLVAGIVVSLSVTVWTLSGLEKGAVGRVSDFGNVSLVVSNQLSITLNSDHTVDFGTGQVNTSCLTAESQDYANMTKIAGGSYFETCWTGTETGTGFILENNGNLNASISVSGPTNDSFFNSWSTSYDMGVQVRGEAIGGDDGCPNELNSTYADLSANTTICRDLLYDTDSTDSVGVTISVRVPRDIPSDTYDTQAVEFYAVAS